MKKSYLKEAIKSEIKNILTEAIGDDLDDRIGKAGELKTAIDAAGENLEEEATEAKFVKFKGDSDDMKMKVEGEREMNTPDGELKVYRVKTDDGVQSYTADQVELVEEDLNEVYQTRSKMEQIVDLFQDMMDDEYDGVPYPKVLNRLVKFIDDDYKAAEREGEKFSDIREEKETLDSVLKKIKDELEIYKTSKDTDKKKSAVEKLKDLNKKKKDLLNKEEEKIASIGKDQELDA